MNQRIILGLFALVGLFFFTACETDVELTADYKSTPVITGILEYTADTQFVRINRTYLTDGNAYPYAQVRDSIEYDPSEVEAWLIKRQNGNKLDSIELEHIVKPSREPGLFYDTDISFWYTTDELFTESQIQALTSTSSTLNLTYELKVVARGNTYIGETGFPNVVSSSIFRPTTTLDDIKIDFYRISSNGDRYEFVDFIYRPATPSARYLSMMRFNFDYETEDGTVVEDQFIDYQLGTQQFATNGSYNETKVSFNAENWYAFVGNILKDIPGIETVRIKDLEYHLTGANDILNSYINVAQPISDFTPVLSNFTNINNGAIGIVGSRTKVLSKFILRDPSIKIMNEGEYSYGINYCVQSWAGSNYDCN